MSLTETAPYDLIGGAPGVRRLAERFYAIMAEDPGAAKIRAMHAEDLAPIIDRLSGFLSGWMGGPRDYFERPDKPCIMSVHHKYWIGPNERDQWLACMSRALDDCEVKGELRAMLEPAFAKLADAMRSQ